MQVSQVSEQVARLALQLTEGIGPLAFRRLLQQFGSAKDVLSAPRQRLLEVSGISPAIAQRLSQCDLTTAEEELLFCQQHDIEVDFDQLDVFPENLQQIVDPPGILFRRGSYEPQDTLALAIVGTRHATSYGQRIAKRLSTSLAQAGFTIVSGLARGIDACAHHAALAADGRTIAVLAGGLMNLYPPEHKELAYEISQQGCLLTEFPSRWPINRGAFPRRNRIITGLSLGVIVVEAGDRSGALVSARHAMEQGREVMAVPGPIDSRMSRGCHALLRDGATLVESVEDVFEALGPLAEKATSATGIEVRHPAELKLNAQETAVLACIESQPTTIDDIVVDSKLPVQRVLATISVLETRRLIRRVSGHQVIRL